MRILLVLATAIVLSAPTVRAAEAFDHYVNTVLGRAPQAKGCKELKQLTPEMIQEAEEVLPGVTAAFVVVKTNEGRWSKLLVQSARRKVDAEKNVPILLVERFVTYKDGTDQTILAEGKNLNLFDGFRLNLDMGQVVPEVIPADLRFVVAGDKVHVEPVGKAKLYLLTQPMPEAKPAKTAKVVVGESFEPRYFTGTYKLHDDGRRSGTLRLDVDDEGAVSGSYVSDKDGEKYEVLGRVGKEKHAIQFTVKLPRTELYFQGWMFTGDGKAIAGSCRLQSRETGFYAVRTDD